MISPFRDVTMMMAALLLAGCAIYRPLPLAERHHLAPSLSALDRSLPGGHGVAAAIAINAPLPIDRIGLLAILNDPELKAERGEIGVARAGVTQASALPNPSATLSYDALLEGPGTVPAYTASLSQDIAAILTYHARVSAAKAHVGAVNANLLWQEWQVAQKARLLALDIYWDDRSIVLSGRERDLLSRELSAVRAATQAGDLDLTALSPLLAAQATVDQALATLRLERLKNWQALDALLGLEPSVRFVIAAPHLQSLPERLEVLLASLPERRPDLVALHLGYESAEAEVRAAILRQFPAFVLGGTWNSDTTGVRTAGPNATFDLPIFNRNQDEIARTRATRRLLHEQYQARLDSATGAVRGLAAQMDGLSASLHQASRASAEADALSYTAQRAYRQGNLDERAVTDYETTAVERQLEVIGFKRTLGEDRIILEVELGLGLPQTRIAVPEQGQHS